MLRRLGGSIGCVSVPGSHLVMQRACNVEERIDEVCWARGAELGVWGCPAGIFHGVSLYM